MTKKNELVKDDSDLLFGFKPKNEKKLTKEQVIEFFTDFIYDENGNASKKCPLCGNDIVVTFNGSSSETKCKTPGCICLCSRGL